MVHLAHPALVVEDLVADLDLAHGGPARRCGDGGVQRQGLSHGGPRRHDDQVGGLQASGQVVEVAEPGRDTGDGRPPLVELLDHLHVLGQQVLQVGQVLRHPPVRHLVDEVLGLVDRLLDVVGQGEGEVGDLLGGVDQPAQGGVLLDDAGVVAHGPRGRHGVDECEEIWLAAELVEAASPPELLAERHGVHWLPPGVEVEHDPEHRGVRRLVEVLGRHRLERGGDGLPRQQACAQHRLLGLEVVGWDATEAGPVRSDLAQTGCHARSFLERTFDPTAEGGTISTTPEPPSTARQLPFHRLVHKM